MISPGTPADRDRRRIADILEHLGSIRSELRVGREAFISDPRAQKIVAYDLAIIGEAAGKVSRRTQEANRAVPWTELVEYPERPDPRVPDAGPRIGVGLRPRCPARPRAKTSAGASPTAPEE